MNKHELRKLKLAKQAEARSILTSAKDEDGTPRDLTKEENDKHEAIMKAIATIDSRVSQLEATEPTAAADEGEGDAADGGEASRSAAPSRRSKPIEGSPAVRGKPRPYLLTRALRLALAGKPIDGLEGELSQELAKRAGRDPEGFFMPMGNEPEFRGLIAAPERRGDLTTGTGAGAIFTSPELPFIELLRSKLVLQAMGVTFLSGMSGKFAIPRQTSTSGTAWIVEGGTLTPNNAGIDQVPFAGKTLGTSTTITRKFLSQTSVDAESFVRNDLAKAVATELDRAGINGSGSGANPTGILQNSTIQANSAALALGANGGVPTFDAIVAMETQVAAANAGGNAPKYLTSPAGRGKLKRTAKIGSTYPVYLWDDGKDGVGEMNGYAAWATTNVPGNLSKGTGTNLSALIYGNWEDLIVATFGGIDVLVNPFTPQLSGGVTISMMMEADVNVRHPESFAIISDMLTS